MSDGIRTHSCAPIVTSITSITFLKNLPQTEPNCEVGEPGHQRANSEYRVNSIGIINVVGVGLSKGAKLIKLAT